MQLIKNTFFFIVILFCISSSSAFFLNRDRPRVISIFSKPAEPDAPKQTGPDIFGHIGNVLHGGSIGVELKPIAGFQGIFGNAKKIIPGGQTYPQVGKPENQKPPPEPYDPPKGGHWEEEENDDKDWEPENPEKPSPVGPSWEDIGEEPEDDDEVNYEGIINPRNKHARRIKRSYINSKIYHVPLTFRSNARPFQVKFINMDSKERFANKRLNSLLRK